MDTVLETDLCEPDQRRDTRGRRIAEKQERERILGEYAQSGLTLRAFARLEGINYHTLCGWRYRYGRSKGSKSQLPVRFTEVEVPAGLSAGPLEVVRPDGTVLRGNDAESLARLARLLSD